MVIIGSYDYCYCGVAVWGESIICTQASSSDLPTQADSHAEPNTIISGLHVKTHGWIYMISGW